MLRHVPFFLPVTELVIPTDSDTEKVLRTLWPVILKAEFCYSLVLYKYKEQSLVEISAIYYYCLFRPRERLSLSVIQNSLIIKDSLIALFA